MEKTLIIDDFTDIGVEVGLLLYAADHLLEERLVDKLLDAAHGKVGHKVLPVAEVTEAIEGVKHVLFQLIKGFRLVFHAKPQHSGRVVAAEDARAVEVHGEGLVPLGHLLAGFYDLGNVLVWGVAHKLQGEVYLVGFAPVDVTTFVLQVSLETLCECGKLCPAVDGNS